MQFSVFCGVSVDGFLARPSHVLDFLDTPDQVPHGFDEFYSSVDAILIDRRTFHVVLSFAGAWGYGSKPVFVLTHRPPDFFSLKGTVVEAISGAPRSVAAPRLPERLRGWRPNHPAVSRRLAHQPPHRHPRPHPHR